MKTPDRRRTSTPPSVRRFRGPPMLRGPTPPSGRLSKKSRAEAGEARGGPSRCRSAVVGRGRDALGPKAGEQQEGVGADREEAHGPLQERIRVDLPLRLPQARKRRGLLDDPAHSEHQTVLFGARGVRKGGGSRHRQAHPFGLGQGRMAHRRGDRPTRRRASGVATLGFTGATTGGKVVAANQRGVGQRPLRGDRRGRANADEPMYGTARSKRADKGPHQLPLVAAGGMTFRELFSRIRYKPFGPTKMASSALVMSSKAVRVRSSALWTEAGPTG